MGSQRSSRKGISFPGQAFPSGSGDSRAEAQRRQGVAEPTTGVGRVNALIRTFFEGVDGGRREKVSAFPSRISHPHPESFPQRARWRFRPVYGGGSVLWSAPNIFGEFLDKPFQQGKAVADNCSDVAASPPSQYPIVLCVLCVLCGRLSPSGSGWGESPAEGEMENRGRYRYRYRMDAGWDSDLRNRVTQPYCCGADTTRQEVGAGHEGQRPTGTGIDFDFDFDPDFDFDFDFDRSDGSDGSATPRTRCILVYVNVYRFAVYVYVSGPSLRRGMLVQRPVSCGTIGVGVGIGIDWNRGNRGNRENRGDRGDRGNRGNEGIDG